MRGLVVLGFLVAGSLARAQESPVELDDLVRTALDQRANLQARRSDIAAAAEVPSRVGSPPDPMISSGLSNLRTDDRRLDESPMSGITVGLTQRIPFPGKLHRRAEAARAVTTVVERVLTSHQARVALSVESAYWDLWFSQQSLTIMGETERVLDNLANAVIARFAVGGSAQQDALQVEAAHSSVRSSLIELRQRVVSSARATERAAGVEPRGSLRASSEPSAEAASAATARARLNRQNPEIQVHTANIAAQRAALAAARRDQYPDFVFGAGYRFRREVMGDPTQGADMFSLSLGVTLPLFVRRNQGARVRELEHRVEAARLDRDDVELDARAALERALDAIERVDAQLQLYRSELLAQTDAALGASIEDYQFGRVMLNTVLENWRIDLATRLDFERLRAQRATQLAILAALLGERTEREAP